MMSQCTFKCENVWLYVIGYRLQTKLFSPEKFINLIHYQHHQFTGITPQNTFAILCVMAALRALLHFFTFI